MPWQVGKSRATLIKVSKARSPTSPLGPMLRFDKAPPVHNES
jgi:hypothetical protein